MQASACSADRGSRIPVVDSKVSVAETRYSIRVNLGPGQDHRPVDGAQRSHAAENFHAQPRRFHSRPAPRAVQIGGCYQLGGCASIGRSVRMSVMGPNSEKLRVSISCPRCPQERTSRARSRITSRDFVHNHSASTTGLIGHVFLSRPQRQGTRIGGGNECLFVMIPVRQSSSHYAPLEHD